MGWKGERSAIDPIRSSRLLCLSFHCIVHIRDKIERPPKRNSAEILCAAPQPKSVLLLRKVMEKYKNSRKRDLSGGKLPTSVLATLEREEGK